MVTITNNSTFSALAAESISVEEAKKMIYDQGFSSAVETDMDAKAVSTLLGIKCPATNASRLRIGRGDVLLVFTLKTKLPEKDEYEVDEVKKAGYHLAIIRKL